MSEVTKRIDFILSEKGISKKVFYEACNITSSAYSQWNTGKTIPSKKALHRVCAFLGLNYEWLTTGEGEAETKTPPTQEGERELDDRKMKVAFLGGMADGLSDEAIDRYWNDARGYIGYKIQQDKNKAD